MTVALLVVVLAVIWIAVSGSLSVLSVSGGLVLAILTLLLLRQRVAIGPWLRRIGHGLGLAGYFIKELLLSSIRVGVLTLTPGIRGRLRPGIVAVPISLKGDIQITLLASLITLTPGTLSVDVAEDGQTLFVHALTLDSREALIEQITNGFAARIGKVFA